MFEQHRVDAAESSAQGEPSATVPSASVSFLLWNMSLCKSSELSTAGKSFTKEEVHKMLVQPFRFDHKWIYHTGGVIRSICRRSLW